VTTANRIVFGNFGTASSLAQPPSAMAEVMLHSEFGSVILSWVGWIHSCNENMLLPLWIDAQREWQNVSFLALSGEL